MREKLQNAVMFDQKLYDRLVAEVPKVRRRLWRSRSRRARYKAFGLPALEHSRC